MTYNRTSILKSTFLYTLGPGKIFSQWGRSEGKSVLRFHFIYLVNSTDMLKCQLFPTNTAFSNMIRGKLKNWVLNYLESLNKSNSITLNYICMTDLKIPSGSKGAKHHAGALSRKGPAYGEFSVQACSIKSIRIMSHQQFMSSSKRSK